MKTFHRIPSATKGKLILGVLMTILAYGAAANAEPAFSGKFVLPQEVRWNHAVLPAGEYTIEMRSDCSPGRVALEEYQQVLLHGPADGFREPQGRHRNQHHGSRKRAHRAFSQSPGIGHALIFAPLTKAEIETLARAGETEVVPMITARK